MGHTETFVDGIWYPSATTILGSVEKPWLEAWHKKWGATEARGSLSERKTHFAKVIGDEFHRRVELLIRQVPSFWNDGLSVNMNSRVDGMLASFGEWADSVDGKIDEVEMKVVSKEYAYSGTFDAVGTLNGKFILFDWKTSSRIYDEYELQLAAYAQAYAEMTGKRAKEGLIVHVSKQKPSYKLTTKTFKLGKRALNKFLKLRANFDDVRHLPEIMEATSEEANIPEETGC